MKAKGVKPDKNTVNRGPAGFFRDIFASDALYLPALFIVNFIWFSFIKFKTLMGDDIALFSHFSRYGSVFDALTDSDGGRYRPIFMAWDYILYNLAGNNYSLYVFINIVMNCVIIYVVYKIFDYLLKNKLPAFLFSLVFLTSRFSYYNIMQQQGMLEALALFLFASILYFVIKYLNENKKRHIIFAVILGFLIPFVHERFLAVPLLLSLTLFVLNRELKAPLAAISLFSVALNVFIKTFIFKTRFFLGTGGQAVDFSNVAGIVKFVLTGLANMLGINAGPRYLAGIYFEKSQPLVIVFSLLIFFACLLAVIIYIAGVAKKKELSLFSVLTVSVISFLGMILTASICMRQEFRWLYAPYLLWLVLLSICVKKVLTTDKLKYIFLTVFTAMSLYNNIYHRDNLGDFYIIYAQKCADSLYAETIDKYGKTVADNHDLYIQNFRDNGWITIDSLFFDLYTGRQVKNKIHWFDKPADLKISNPSAARIYLFDYNSLSFTETTLKDIRSGEAGIRGAK